MTSNFEPGHLTVRTGWIQFLRDPRGHSEMGSRDHGMVEFGVQIPMAPLTNRSGIEAASNVAPEMCFDISAASVLPPDFRRTLLSSSLDVQQPSDQEGAGTPEEADQTDNNGRKLRIAVQLLTYA